MKVKELMEIVEANVSIMNGIFCKVTINKSTYDESMFSKEFLYSSVRKIDTCDGLIRVWVNE